MIEKLALAAINSDRAADGWPPLTSREDVPDSDGYPRMVKAVLEAARDGLTDKMLDQGQHVNSEWLNDSAPIGEAMYRAPAKAVFTAMINPALEYPSE
jgi:hypothetical protein